MRFILALLLIAASIPTSAAVPRLDPARVIELEYSGVYDGDTVNVRLNSLPEPLNRLRVRIAGIDTPELGQKAKCAYENELAKAARARLAEVLAGQPKLLLRGFRWDKYGGRLDGTLLVNGENVAAVMIREGHAAPYSGEGPRRDWCAAAK